jgi:hypothetical protein
MPKLRLPRRQNFDSSQRSDERKALPKGRTQCRARTLMGFCLASNVVLALSYKFPGAQTIEVVVSIEATRRNPGQPGLPFSPGDSRSAVRPFLSL